MNSNHTLRGLLARYVEREEDMIASNVATESDLYLEALAALAAPSRASAPFQSTPWSIRPDGALRIDTPSESVYFELGGDNGASSAIALVQAATTSAQAEPANRGGTVNELDPAERDDFEATWVPPVGCDFSRDSAGSYSYLYVDNAWGGWQARALRATPVAEPKGWRDALKFYAERSHFDIADKDAWDTVSGEASNLWFDEAGTASVEDGTVAAKALAGTPLPSDEDAAAQRPVGAQEKDAARYRWLKPRLLSADFAYGDPSEACCALVFEIPEDMSVSADLDATIDAALPASKGEA